ncbi:MULTISPECIES: hypothetical protein [Paenibacillus]|uniref:hypothetical protein n=1 Tax=Paenibacillus TaxID=44249 RepID=UPI0022B8DD67|nr:hypothetical protein [Paenibacillus caseinilyticus]MCZ8519441.1 hypothetical protein [Paenibacillus caseinilyticus]
MTNYRLSVGEYSLVWGTPVKLDTLHASGSSLIRQPGGIWDWELPEGVYLAREVVRELAVLLDAVVDHFGGAYGYEPLLDNVKQSLALSGRESVLQLGSLTLADPTRIQLAEQARRIGDTLSQWAREQAAEGPRYDKEVLGALRFRSRCDNHLWTPLVTEMLTGPHGGPAVMQLFNEYLHQLVLLRDVLLPYANWEEVPLVIKRRDKGKGLRFTEQARTAFLAEVLMGRPSHQSLVRYAQSGLAPELSSAGYGFQYRYGTILPASLGTYPAAAQSSLLRWYPVRTVPHSEDRGSISVVFDYASPDYYSVPRSQVDAGVSSNALSNGQELHSLREARLEIIPVEGDSERVQLQYRLQIGSTEYGVDLGQILRGQRYMYPARSHQLTGETAHHTAANILSLPGLASADAGTHHISAAGHPLVVWALLGKLYPENVFVLDGASGEQPEGAGSPGKGFGAKFWIT